MRQLTVKKEIFPLKKAFNIAHGSRNDSYLVYVAITENGITGEGEGYPYPRYHETTSSTIRQIEAARRAIEEGCTRAELQKIMPAGSARNAVDLALWDLEAKQKNLPLWQLAGLPAPKKLSIPYTLVIDEPQQMQQEAVEQTKVGFKIFKIKLAGDGFDDERLNTIRKAVPDAQLVIDANEAWRMEDMLAYTKLCKALKIEIIEQPFPAKNDHFLEKTEKFTNFCADESCHTSQDLEKLKGKYNMVNIKLDKTGGLTEALKLYKAAKEQNFKVMVGCMVSSSLSIRPAYYLAQLADFADLDGPYLLKQDRANGLIFQNGAVSETAL